MSDPLRPHGLYSPPGSPVHGILQARILEWVAMPFSRGSSWPGDQTCLSCGSCTAGGFFTTEPPGKRSSFLVWLCHTPVTPWTVAYYAPLSMRFPRQDYWLDCHFPSPGDLPDPVIEPSLPHCRRILYWLSSTSRY